LASFEVPVCNLKQPALLVIDAGGGQQIDHSDHIHPAKKFTSLVVGA